MMTCPICGEKKADEEFAARTSRPVRLCKLCQEARYEECRDDALQKKYGLNLEWEKETLKKQDHKCLICKGPFTETPCVDHCHVTFKIRGLLCRNCNAGLGNFKDSKVFLQSAIEHLDNFTD